MELNNPLCIFLSPKGTQSPSMTVTHCSVLPTIVTGMEALCLEASAYYV